MFELNASPAARVLSTSASSLPSFLPYSTGAIEREYIRQPTKRRTQEDDSLVARALLSRTYRRRRRRNQSGVDGFWNLSPLHLRRQQPFRSRYAQSRRWSPCAPSCRRASSSSATRALRSAVRARGCNPRRLPRRTPRPGEPRRPASTAAARGLLPGSFHSCPDDSGQTEPARCSDAC